MCQDNAAEVSEILQLGFLAEIDTRTVPGASCSLTYFYNSSKCCFLNLSHLILNSSN